MNVILKVKVVSNHLGSKIGSKKYSPMKNYFPMKRFLLFIKFIFGITHYLHSVEYFLTRVNVRSRVTNNTKFNVLGSMPRWLIANILFRAATVQKWKKREEKTKAKDFLERLKARRSVGSHRDLALSRTFRFKESPYSSSSLSRSSGVTISNFPRSWLTREQRARPGLRAWNTIQTRAYQIIFRTKDWSLHLPWCDRSSVWCEAGCWTRWSPNDERRSRLHRNFACNRM